MKKAMWGWLLLAIGIICPFEVRGQTPDFAIKRQFTAEVMIVTKAGSSTPYHIAVDGGKIRTDVVVHGIEKGMIIRPDLGKVYQVMTAQKMVMELPYEKMTSKKQFIAATLGESEGTWVFLNQEKWNGIDCLKFKFTTKEDVKTFFWLDAQTKLPIQMQSDDGLVVAHFTKFILGQPDRTLFAPPPDFQLISLHSEGSVPSH